MLQNRSEFVYLSHIFLSCWRKKRIFPFISPLNCRGGNCAQLLLKSTMLWSSAGDSMKAVLVTLHYSKKNRHNYRENMCDKRWWIATGGDECDLWKVSSHIQLSKNYAEIIFKILIAFREKGMTSYHFLPSKVLLKLR